MTGDKFVVLNDRVEVKWSTRTKGHYVERGYKYTAMGDTFRVDVSDLPEQSKIKVLVQCPECKLTRKVAWQSIAGKDNTYCQKCGSKVANFDDLTGKAFGRLYVQGLSDRRGNRGQYYYNCLCECGNETEVEASALSSGATQSCGCLQREISSERMSGMTGEKNPMWDATKSDEDRYSRHSEAAHQAWREEVLERDGYMCRCCGSDGPLHAHHIRPYTENKSLRVDVENGITLCDRCHMEFHASYGAFGVTEIELAEFMGECSE